MAILHRWLCAIGRHDWFIGSVNLSGHQSYRTRSCRRRCGVPTQQQHLTWGGSPTGPWRDDVRPPCTHGVGGVKLLACMRCATDRQKAGLR